MKAFTIDNQGRVICDQCGDTSPRLDTMARQTEWQRYHRQTCPLKRSGARRSTSNSNVRGNTEQRRKRKAWLVEHWRANSTRVTAVVDGEPVGRNTHDVDSLVRLWERWGFTDIVVHPTCRCWECGTLLTAETVVADRIVPGSEGGSYARNNLRPHCKDCSERQGGRIGQVRKAARR